MTIAQFTLGQLFDVRRGLSELTTAYAREHVGPYPIYSAATNSAMSFSSRYDYEGRYITVSANGYAGRTLIVDGRFSINADRFIFIPRIEGLEDVLEIIALLAQQVLKEEAVGRRVDGKKNEYTKLSKSSIVNSEISLPVTSSGDLDLVGMHNKSRRIARIDAVKTSLRARRDQIENVDVLVEGADVDSFKKISLGDARYFKLSIGKRVLKSELAADSLFPVYSANARIPMGGVENIRDGMEFSRPSLIWGIDGIFDWNLIPANQPFVPTDHCGRAEIISDDLDPLYLLHVLRATRYEYGFDRVFRASLKNIKEVSVGVPLKNDSFNLTLQNSISRAYVEVENSKLKTLGLLDGVLEVEVVQDFV